MPGALSVTLHSVLKMPKSFAGSLAILLKVNTFRAGKVPLVQMNNFIVDITLIHGSYITTQLSIVR